ncbi:MAG: ABC transporter permease, partial [Bacteroidota bacterium]
MFKHNLLISYRNIVRNKASFLINLVGLSTGLASVLLIYLWVSDEWSVDRFHEHEDRLYQVMTNLPLDKSISTLEFGPSLLARDLEEHLPEVEIASQNSATFMSPTGVIRNQLHAARTKGLYVDNNFLRMFSYPLIAGNSDELLQDQSSMIITRSLANSLFGSPEEALGKELQWETQFFNASFFVSGVLEDVPENSSIQFDLLLSFEDWLIERDPDVASWSDGYAQTYLRLKEGTVRDKFEQKLETYLREKHEFWKESSLIVRQYSHRYLQSEYENGKVVGGRISYVKQLSLLAFFILLIACINYINLTTAQASTRMKEIGVKKVIGASRKKLLVQFLQQSTISVFFAFLLALIFVSLLLPSFNELTLKSLKLQLNRENILALSFLMFLTAWVAGAYPAFYLSGFKPFSTLKAKANGLGSGNSLRKGLVVFQFVLAVIFIVAVLVIHKQMEYTQNKNLGYDRSNIISFFRPLTPSGPLSFFSELNKIPGVEKVANMSGSILSGSSLQKGYSWRGNEKDEEISFQAPMIGYGAMEILEMEIVEGRSFSKDFGDDPNKIILNESAAKMMGLDQPIG